MIESEEDGMMRSANFLYKMAVETKETSSNSLVIYEYLSCLLDLPYFLFRRYTSIYYTLWQGHVGDLLSFDERHGCCLRLIIVVVGSLEIGGV